MITSCYLLEITVFSDFKTSKKCIEIAVTWISYSISEFENHSNMMIFFKASDTGNTL